MNRPTLWILVFASATIFFGVKTYRALTGPVLPGEVPPAGAALSPPSTAMQPQTAPEKAAFTGLSSLLARPVFRPDRRPYQGEGAENPQRNYESELSRYTVLGVLTMGDKMVALVVGTGASKGERWEVGAGDSLPGFTVKEVSLDGLVLTADDREFPLPLYAGGPKGGGRTPVRTEVSSRPAKASQPKTVRSTVPPPRRPPGPGTTALPGAPGAASAPAPSKMISPPTGSQAEILRNRMRRTFKPGTR